MPEPQPATYNPNSLWRTGSRAFFKDQRATRSATSSRSRSTSPIRHSSPTRPSAAAPILSAINNFFGAPTLPLINLTLPGTLLNADSTASSDGKGSINRQETLQTNIAAVVTQVLPNGNLVVEGKQEIRVNTEVRELIVGGIVRPEDIQSDNLIDSSKIAEARIAYGGRGQISDVQQPRYGQQVFDVLLPFQGIGRKCRPRAPPLLRRAINGGVRGLRQLPTGGRFVRITWLLLLARQSSR
jgi:flagellar L-ring protein FlgH